MEGGVPEAAREDAAGPGRQEPQQVCGCGCGCVCVSLSVLALVCFMQYLALPAVAG